VEASNIAFSYGVNLDTFNTTSLKRLAQLPAFTPKEEAQAIINKRAAFENKKSASRST
jgi:hypothetical protein